MKEGVLLDCDVEGVFPVPWKQVRSKHMSIFKKETRINKIKKHWGHARIAGDIFNG